MMCLIVLLSVSFWSYKSLAAQPTPEQWIDISEASTRYAVDLPIALAVAETESQFNEDAVGTHGELGIFQLLPKYHESHSVDDGVRYLALIEKKCRPRYGDNWVLCYNRGPNAPALNSPETFDYSLKVRKKCQKWMMYVGTK